MKYLGFIWALVPTLLGYLFCFVLWCLRWVNRPTWGEDLALVWTVRPGSWLAKRMASWAGFVFGLNVILFVVDDRVLKHEGQHVRDILILGVFFYLIYGGEYVIRWACRWGDPYQDLWLERRARRAEKHT